MNSPRFSWSDTIAGYVKKADFAEKSFVLTTSDGRAFEAFLTENVYAKITHNVRPPDLARAHYSNPSTAKPA